VLRDKYNGMHASVLFCEAKSNSISVLLVLVFGFLVSFHEKVYKVFWASLVGSYDRYSLPKRGRSVPLPLVEVSVWGVGVGGSGVSC